MISENLRKQWNYLKNVNIDIDKILPYSKLKVWWKCTNGHEWKATINDRSHGTGCPYCSGRLPIVGKTDLATIYTELAIEWNFDKNHGLTPQMVTKSSRKKVWWKCANGHEWKATTNDRSHGTGCPYCSGRLPIVGETDLATIYPELAKEWNYEKNQVLTPQMVTKSSNKKVWWKCANRHEWDTSVNHRSKGIGCPYCSGHVTIKGETDLATVYPELAMEWNYEKNYALTPQMITKSSNKKVWWKCTNGHEWEAIVNSRSNGTGCPYCSGRLPIVGKTDLATIYPELAAEWNFDKNHGLTPQMVTKSSGKKVWWKCANGHEWKVNISNRRNGTGCPYCSGRLPIMGKTDLATIYPELAIEWNFDMNHGLTPQMVTKSSNKKVWWKCTNRHEWDTSIKNRSQGIGCPYCSNNIPIKGETDLATVYPELAMEWNYEKNYALTPQMVTKSSNKKVWWKCTNGHEWEAMVNSRSNGRGCPYCSGRLPIVGKTDLATIYPELAIEWNFNMNHGLTPQMVKKSSRKKVWWKCEKGHEWRAIIYNRTKGKRCPLCSSKKIKNYTYEIT